MGDVDYTRLEAYLKTLAQANRLELLHILRAPRTLDEIHLAPAKEHAGETPERNITRQGVANHLDKLVEAGLVRVGSTDRKGRRALNEYVLDHARVFALVEELRKISEFGPHVPLDPFATIQMPETAAEPWESGPKLVLVHGVREGTSFPLKPSAVKPPRGWIVGRSGESHVCLEYDPYVSAENAEIIHRADGYRVLDLRTAKNGTFLNWRRLPAGGEASLANGDVLGLGRSLLVFRDA